MEKPLIHVTNDRGQFDEDEHIQKKLSSGLKVNGAGPWFRLSPANVNVDVGVQPRPTGLGTKVVNAYGMEMGRLRTLAGQGEPFRSYVLSHVKDVTERLGGAGKSQESIDRDTDQATFSLVMELYSLGNGLLEPKLEAALLDLGSHLKGLRFAKTTDALGRPASRFRSREPDSP